jgi:hypothetical protein
MLKSMVDWFMPKEEEAARALPGRNEPCHCGSGIKYKKCCMAEDERKLSVKRSANCGAS